VGAPSDSCLRRWRGDATPSGFFRPRKGEQKTAGPHHQGGFEAEGTPNHVVPLHVLHRSQGRWRAAGEHSPVGGTESQTPGVLIGLNPQRNFPGFHSARPSVNLP
jgi:hypothetical protein